MKTYLGAALGVSLLVGCVAEGPTEISAEEQATLAEALRGYEQAGPPVACVDQRVLGGNRSVGDAILFTGPTQRLWVNRPAAGCPHLNSGRALRTRTSVPRLCRGDIVTVMDVSSGMDHGACGLGDFTLYRRVGRGG